jgi:hypothetical protein
MRHRGVDDDDEVKDGETIRVPLYLCDHQPRHAKLTDEVRKIRQTTRTEYLTGLQDAWKSPAQRAMDQGQPDLGDAVRDSRAVARTARADYIARTCDAWKPRDAQPDLGTPPEELRRPRGESDPTDPSAAKTREREIETWQGRDPAELAELARDVEARGRAQHAEFSSTLSNAWKANPTAATQIERQGERWRGGR